MVLWLSFAGECPQLVVRTACFNILRSIPLNNPIASTFAPELISSKLKLNNAHDILRNFYRKTYGDTTKETDFHAKLCNVTEF